VWKEAVIVSFKILLHLPGKTEENHEKLGALDA
jgi:hypothetical protein